MLKLSVGKGRQVIKQLRVLQYYATVATERVGYVLYRALVIMLAVEAQLVYITYNTNAGKVSIVGNDGIISNVGYKVVTRLSQCGQNVGWVWV